MTDRQRASLMGGFVAVAALCLMAWVFWGPRGVTAREWLGGLLRFTFQPTRHIRIDPQNLRLVHGDPVFQLDGGGRWKQVGHVAELSPATVVWYQRPWPTEGQQWKYHEAPRDLRHVLGLLAPPQRRAAIESQIRAALREHGGAIQASLEPLVLESVRESLPLIQRGVSISIDRHREELDAIAARYRQEIVRERLLPLIRTEVLPVVQQYAQPLAEEIGRELWDRASLWRFGWRYLYDTSPLPERALVRGEWERFVQQEVIPVVRSHEEDFIVANGRIMESLSENAEIHKVLTEVGSDLLEDAELRRFLLKVLRESVLENEELRERWREIWNSERASAALADAADRLEPAIRAIGDELFGTREGGITPEFARVLRLAILEKDRRWIVVSERVKDSGLLPQSSTVDEDRFRPVLELAAPGEPYPLLVGWTNDTPQATDPPTGP
jgi:hypothetical protein